VSNVIKLSAAKLRLKSNAPSTSKPKVPSLIGGHFVRGPVPVSWLAMASEGGKGAAKVGQAIWHLSGMNKKALTVRLSNFVMQRWKVSRGQKTRAIKYLEAAGLISVERKGKCAPMVTILHADGKDVPGYTS
jgi:hypothetical protein